MRITRIALVCWGLLACEHAAADQARHLSGVRKENNLVSVLLDVESAPQSDESLSFLRPSDGWIFIEAAFSGSGAVGIVLDEKSRRDAVVVARAEAHAPVEAMRRVPKGEHTLRLHCEGSARVARLTVKSIPELIHCGLGFDPQIKSYGHYDMDFLKQDILPNVTTLIVPGHIELPQPVVENWHRQGKWFVAEVGVNSRAKSVDEHFKNWTGAFERVPYLDGIIINEFGMNRKSRRPNPDREKRAAQRHSLYEQAFSQLRADPRYKDKMVYAYFGGSGNVMNYEDTGRTFVRTILNRDYRIALERYIYERSSPGKSSDALQAFVDGIADWAHNEPGVKEKMVIAFGLFSMPPGGINKLPNVDYHVWMDQQMNVLANYPTMSGIGGVEWWTSTLTDEETVRFVGKLYRHYGIRGETRPLLADPLFMTHIQNADFEKGTEGWTLHPAEAATIEARSFPRYGRIEGRYMGLGRPADPEHIGDTFLWMKRSPKGPNTFSQTIRDLQRGRLYSMKMFSCDYKDLIAPRKKTEREATPFLGKVTLRGVDLDLKRSFTEMYASTPEPKIPVWITYHWKVFKALGPTAQLTVSDWPDETKPGSAFGQEQTFNFVEIQPYHE